MTQGFVSWYLRCLAKSRRKAEKEKLSRGHPSSPLVRNAREREQVKLDSKIAAKGDETKSARNTRSKFQLKGDEPTTESK